MINSDRMLSNFFDTFPLKIIRLYVLIMENKRSRGDVMGKKAKEEDQFKNEFLDEADVLAEVKVSDDEGETWKRRKISMVSGLEESGLMAGEMFQFGSEKYKVMQGEDGLITEPLNKPKK